jgi:hypothetical protein
MSVKGGSDMWQFKYIGYYRDTMEAYMAQYNGQYICIVAVDTADQCLVLVKHKDHASRSEEACAELKKHLHK